METSNDNVSVRNGNDSVVYYTLIDVQEPSYEETRINLLLKRSKTFLSCTHCFLTIGFLCVLFATTLPLWSVTVYNGPADIFMVETERDVSFLVGSGVFVKNYCIFFDQKPSDDVLARFDVHCEASSTLEGCEFDSHGRDVYGNEECNRIHAAQSLSYMSALFAIVAFIIACCAVPQNKTGMAMALYFSLLAGSSSYSVIQIMQETDMVKNSKAAGCRNNFGAEVCNENPPSSNFQDLGTTCLFLASASIILSACCAYQAMLKRNRESTNQVSTIRYAVPAGVVIA